MFKRYVFVEGLTNLLGSNGKFLINNDGQIKDIKGNDLEYRRDDEGNRIVHCLGWAGERDYRVIDLVALQFKGLKIPKDDYDKVIAFTIDGNLDNTHAENIGYRFKGGKLEVKKSGFYYVPGFTGIGINTDGLIIDSETLRIKKTHISSPVPKKNIKGGYVNFSIPFHKGMPSTGSRHRAMCLVFKEYPDNADSITVNHRNGIPGNDWLDNLEWATRSENNNHAYANDLKNQNEHVLVRNVLTGEVIDHYSISEAARALGFTTHATIWHRLFTSEFSQVFGDGTQVKLKSDARDWILPDNPEEEIRKNLQRIPILVRDCKTLQVNSYECIADAAKATNIESGSINYRLTVGNYSPLFGFQFKRSDDLSPWKTFTPDEYQASLKPNSYSVDARNLFTGETASYSSIREAEIALNGLSITFAFQKDTQPLNEDGWQVKRSNDEWEEVTNFEERLYKLRREVMAREETSGKIIIAASAKHMAETLKVDPKAIRTASFTRGNKLYHGYRFRLGVTTEPWPNTVLPSQ